MRRIDTELVRNLSVRARKMFVLKIIGACETKKEAAKLLGVSRTALHHYLNDDYQMSDTSLLKILAELTKQEFHEILLEDLIEYAELVIEKVGIEAVKKKLTALFTFETKH